MSIIDQVAETIHRFNMIVPRDRVLVAVSGGPDSMALLDILQTLAHRLETELAVAHLNHGIRGATADREEAFVQKMARDHRVPFYMDNIELSKNLGSLEEHARRERYAFLTRVAQTHGYTRIALGHHADDNAESLLIYLLRGSGNRGLGGIPPVRDRWIVRPLIEVRRKEILTYLESRGLGYMQDDSNDDLRFVRNRIRHRLMPMLEQEFNPGIVQTLNRTATICREEEGWFQSYLSPLLESLQLPAEDKSLRLRMAPLTKAHPAIQRRLLREALRQWHGHLQRIGAVHVEALTGLIASGQSGKRLNLPGGLVAYCTGEELRFSLRSRQDPCFRDICSQDTGSNDRPPSYSYWIMSGNDLPTEISIDACNGKLAFALTAPPSAAELKEGHPDLLWLDVARIHFPLTIRNMRAGDRLIPMGMNGRQKVKKAFIDAKTPRLMRRCIPLIISGKEILWVAGIRRGNEALVTEETREVLRVEWRYSLADKWTE